MLKKENKKPSVLTLVKKNIKVPEKNEMIFTIEDNGDAIFDYLLNICVNKTVQECFITSFRIGKKDLGFLEELIINKKLPDVVNLLLSDSIKTMVVGTYNYLEKNVNFKTNYINTHSKYALLKTEQGDNYCIFSSGNFNPDGKIEQLTILNCEKTYNFYKKINIKCQEEIKI